MLLIQQYNTMEIKMMMMMMVSLATGPHNEKKAVASGTGNVPQAKQYRDPFSISSSSDESDYGGNNYDKRAKVINTNKETNTNSAPNWEDCVLN
jgi:hypothetical protein